jgi:hypothetical protein
MMFNSPHTSAPMLMRGNALVFEKHLSKYADDGYIMAKLSVALEVLSDIKHVLREDTGLDLNDKTKILVKGISAAEAHTAAQRLLTADPSLAHLGPLLAPKALMMMSSICSCRNKKYVDDCYIGLGVPNGTDAFVQHFVKKKCQEIVCPLRAYAILSSYPPSVPQRAD